MIKWIGDHYPDVPHFAPHSTTRDMPALFLDLDGTVRRSRTGQPFPDHIGDIELFPDVEKKVWEFRDRGYLIFGVTNQGGVAYGYKTLRDVDEETQRTGDLFEDNPFALIKACPYHPRGHVEPFNIHSLQRKPGCGMLVLIEEFVRRHWAVNINWANSIMIGDRSEDRECAMNAGVTFNWAWHFFGRPDDRKVT